jgi:hypothetical protein
MGLVTKRLLAQYLPFRQLDTHRLEQITVMSQKKDCSGSTSRQVESSVSKAYWWKSRTAMHARKSSNESRVDGTEHFSHFL